MPYYDYQCQACKEIVEIKKGINDPAPIECPRCHELALERHFSEAPGFELKGTWFKNSGQY